MIKLSEIDISIIIVNYKTPKLLFNCIESIEKNKENINIEVIVVDNHSEDESESIVLTNFPHVIWKNVGYNAGFSRANNMGIGIAKGEYILLLNSDTVIIDDCLQKTLKYYKKLEDDSLNPGLLGCKMKDLNDNILFNSNLFFPGIKKVWNANAVKIFFSRKKQKSPEQITHDRELQHLNNHECAWLGVAFALCNRKLFDKDGLFMDEDFFMYGEDMEWCYRIAEKGYRNFFFADVEIYHINCGSSGFSEWKTGQIIISEWLYIYKTKGYFYYLIYLALLKFNLFVDKKLYLRVVRNNKINNEDILAYQIRLLISSLIKIYSTRITNNFKLKTSSGKEFLKYDVKKVS